MGDGGNYEEVEESKGVEEVKGDSSVDIWIWGHKVRSSFFHPRRGKLRDPDSIDSEKGEDRLNENCDGHIYMIADCCEWNIVYRVKTRPTA